jgi:predicted AlkP superfamily pyrophosphatase or phosphodiesterase
MIALPNYQNSFLGVLSSIRRYFKASNIYQSNDLLDEVLARRYKNVVLIVLEGLSDRILRANLPTDTFLRAMRRRTVTSVFPSAKLPCLHSFLSGTAPNEHGVIGNKIFFKEYGAVYSAADVAISSPVNEIAHYEDIFKGISETVNPPKVTVLSDINLPIDTENTTFERIADFAAAAKKIRTVCRSEGDTFTGVYMDETAEIIRKFGTISDELYEALMKIDSELTKLQESLRETVFIVLPTHGFTDLKNRVSAASVPGLSDTLIIYPTLANRAANFFVKPDRIEEFFGIYDELMRYDFTLYSRAQVKSQNLFGLYRSHKRIDDFLGDCLMVSIGGCEVSDGGAKPDRAVCGGITEDEMILPLIIAETEQDRVYESLI